MPSTFSPLEREVLTWICESYPADRTSLKEQLSTAKLDRRENTGSGFFTHFLVDRNTSSPIPGERVRNGPQAKIEGLKYGMGFILWLERGYADCLEGYAYGPDSTTDLPFESVKFQILAPEQ